MTWGQMRNSNDDGNLDEYDLEHAAYRPFHILDRAWRYLCLRFSTQVGWLILGLLAWVIIGR